MNNFDKLTTYTTQYFNKILSIALSKIVVGKLDESYRETINSTAFIAASSRLSSRYQSVEAQIAKNSFLYTNERYKLDLASVGLTSQAKTKLKKEALDRAVSISETIKNDMKYYFQYAADNDMTEIEVRNLFREKFSDKISQGKIDQIVNREFRASQQYGQEHAIDTALEKGKINKAYKTWVTAGDEKVRSSHLLNDGVKIPWEDAFPNGQKRPHDGLAGLQNDMGCRCSLTITTYKEEE